jgi:hypothetical protein
MAEADKLDAPSRYLLSRLEVSDPELEQEVGVLLRGRGDFTGPELDALRADGAKIETVAGDILSATVPLTALPALTRHDFVVSVQLSQPLRPEAPEQPAPPFYDVE